MSFNSVGYLFFLGLSLIVLTEIPKKFRIHYLFLLGMIWNAFWNTYWIFAFIAIILISYSWLRFALKSTNIKKNCLRLVAFNGIIYILLKSGGIGKFEFNPPYGISFFMFILIGLILDMSKAKSEQELDSLSHVLLLPSFFPALMAGPIIKQRDLSKQFNNLTPTLVDDIVPGLLIYAYGFLKIHLFSLPIDNLHSCLSKLATGNFLLCILGIGFLSTLKTYIQFSSYCDMGRGTAKCFGIDLPVNFKPFYYSKNPNDFWQRWNISLGTWIRDYLSFPMMLTWGRKINQAFILMLSFLLVGVWHGITFNWIIFGLFNGLMVVGYNQFIKKWSLPSVGYFFCWIIYIGNGIFQHPKILLIFKRQLSSPLNQGSDYASKLLIGSIEFKEIIASYFTIEFFLLIVLFIVVEYFQEKKGDLDWPFKISYKLNLAMLVIFFGWVFWQLNENRLINFPNYVPLYFRI